MKRIFVVLVVAILSTNVLAQPPPEIAKHFAEPGTVLAYARWENPVWKFSNDEVLEIIIAIDKRPHVLWSRQPPR
jgi:hypothetical protein